MSSMGMATTSCCGCCVKWQDGVSHHRPAAQPYLGLPLGLASGSPESHSRLPLSNLESCERQMLPHADRLPPVVPWAPEAIEGMIGDVAAAAAAVLSHALRELKQDGLISASTRRVGGELVAMLHELKWVTAGEVAFISTVRTFGTTALRSRCAADVVALDTLIASVLEILGPAGQTGIDPKQS